MKYFVSIVVGIIIAFIIPLCSPVIVDAYEIIDDNFSVFNSSLWNDNESTESGGIVEITSNSYLHLSSPLSNYFPYINLKGNIIPENNYHINIRFMFSGTHNYGSGIIFSNKLLQNHTTENLRSDDVIFHIWPNGATTVGISSSVCSQNSSLCDDIKIPEVITSVNFNTWNSVEIYSNEYNAYNLFLNGNLVYTSKPSSLKISNIWFGNPQKTTTLTRRPEIFIDYFNIYRLSNSTVRSTILIPGLGASWDIGAILTGNQNGNWQIPSFVNQYDGLINSFINAGYTKDTNLFVFPYDWRKPLNILADRLKIFIDSNIPPGEKVNIVGHSMGGLVARAYAQTNGTSKVNKIVTVGTPNMGVTKAYGVWEGATVWDDVWWTKVAIDLTTHFGAMSNEIQTVRDLVPSIKDLLPTYNFLKLNSVLLSWSSLTQKNDYLNTLNQNISSINSLTTAIYSNNVPTDKIIGVISPSTEDLALNKWVDGKPDGSTFEQVGGDGTVIEESAKGLFSNTLLGTWWHGELVTKKENIQKIFGVLGLDIEKALEGSYDSQKNVFVASLQSPGVFEVCNVDISKCNDQLGLYFPNYKLFILPGYNNENLVVRITENGTKGDYSLHLGNINDSSNWKIISGNLSTDSQIDLYHVASDGQSVTAELVDTIAPTAPTITGFHNPELPCGGITNFHSITVDWTDSTDNRGIVDYEYFVDFPIGTSRDQWNTFFTNSEYRGSLNEGVHSIKVRARDIAGNYSEWSNACSITADWTAPVVNISSPISGIYMQNSLPELIYTATDNFDTELLINTSDMPNSYGPHTVTVSATDDAGNVGSANVTYTIQNPPNDKEQCKKNGWKLFGLFKFKNQGDCVSYYEKFERLNAFIHKFTSFWR